MTATYRLRQGLRALLAFSQPVDYALAEHYLSPPLLALFRQMRRSEQLHSLNVLRAVLAQGSPPAPLAIAALLHDVGKIRYPIGTARKTIAVLVRTFAPALYARWGRGNPDHPWERPFVVYERHPHWSGELLTTAHAPAVAVWLATHHQESLSQWADHPNAVLLERLQQADDAN